GAAWDGSMLLSQTDEGGGETPPFIVDARVGRAILGPGREARDVAVQIYSDGKHYEMARVDATVGEKGKLTLRFGQAGGNRDFHLATDDFGATLKLIDITGNIAGGRLSVDGRAEDVGGRRVLRGRAEGADYRLINAPTFAKLLSIASLPTMASLASGEGIPFTRLTGGFELTTEKLVLDKARAYGGALGINASGTIDRVHDTIDLSGTLVPAYTINSILGKIPVLGPLLLGGEGQGLFAANFRAAGPAADPTITVNPLSALAPGFLRNLFLFDVPAGGQTAQEPAPRPPQVGGQ
ncbi:MAG TPA: AsmA-like C-terminal domain-containing protein, partial [Sphingomicrobium sp.]|nr:AsmA-like C-terminal domain-containing protein [Sphingomicrobium sp.]